MGTLLGHVAPGLSFIIIGLWHLVNQIKLHTLNPNTYKSPPWFPSSTTKYLELYLIILGCSTSISTELFLGPHHHPLGPDGSILSTHLRNFEHTNISLTFLAYAIFSILLDRLAPPAPQHALATLLQAAAFAQEFLVFHLHSTDHMGVEGQYHWLLKLAIFTTVATSLLGVSHPESFANGFVRSVSVVFQGGWFMVIAVMLWTPGLVPKGCYLEVENHGKVVRCRDEEALEQAVSLVNIQFSWFFIGMIVFAMTLYLVMTRFYSQKVLEYQSVEYDDDDDDDDVDTQKKVNNV